VNEIELIRTQITTERIHAARAVRACMAALGAAQPAKAHAVQTFRDTCVSYLVWVLARFEQRDQLLAELLQGLAAACGGAHEGSVALELGAIAARPGTSRDALTKLEAALGAGSPDAARSAWEAFAHFFESAWSERRIAIEQHLSRLPGTLHWRAVCAVDADSILEERTRYARLAAQLPEGIALEAPPA
jgi:hypothetical protein